ncbi:MAG TPA: hypothetical protein VN765_06330 [Candidatus Acidoferrum sp.]|nr:hypothetical protein [Candidatus Acidoferrum sp.]
MRLWVLAFCCGLALGRADAQPAAEFVTARSATGQFVALAPRQAGHPVAVAQQSPLPGLFILNPAPAANTGSKLPLEPSVLVISCEKIKQSLLTTLGRSDQWQGLISLRINPALPADQSPLLEGMYSPRGWNYQLMLPSSIEPKLLLRAVVNALLMEDANRHAGAQSAEIPFWLVVGLAAHLQAANPSTLLLRPQSSLDINQITTNGFDPFLNPLREQPPLTFQQLCWPAPETWAGPNYDLYAASSQLFLEELLRFQDGNRCLAAMIDKLPQHLNWQISFLEAFSPHFGRLLDVEKWWALAGAKFSRLDYASRFSPPDSWHKLQQALDVPVEVHFRPDHLPAQAQITLQEVIATWEPAQATAALQRSAESLILLRPQITPDLQPLLERYLSILQSYLNDTRPDSAAWLAKNAQSQLAVVRHAACHQLDKLDDQRAALRSQYVAQPDPAQLNARANATAR